MNVERIGAGYYSTGFYQSQVVYSNHNQHLSIYTEDDRLPTRMHYYSLGECQITRCTMAILSKSTYRRLELSNGQKNTYDLQKFRFEPVATEIIFGNFLVETTSSQKFSLLLNGARRDPKCLLSVVPKELIGLIFQIILKFQVEIHKVGYHPDLLRIPNLGVFLFSNEQFDEKYLWVYDLAHAVIQGDNKTRDKIIEPRADDGQLMWAIGLWVKSQGFDPTFVGMKLGRDWLLLNKILPTQL